MDIYAWLSRQKDIDIEDKQTDTEKILSHGFDKKRSFRNMKRI